MALLAYKKYEVKIPRTNISYKKRMCGPRNKMDVNGFSCYTNNILYRLKEIWNKNHPTNKIHTNEPLKIWKEYQYNIGGLCDNEECWLKKVEQNRELKSQNNVFATPKPKYEDKNEWLSNIDIADVLKKYEKVYHCFEFLGPTPIDYDTKYNSGGFVCNKIANFNLNDFISRGKNKIGVIFNLDKHNQGGSHWVCMFINIRQRFIFYFDSVGVKPPNQVVKLINRIVEQGKRLTEPILFNVEINKIQHQKKNNECGVYCLFVVTTLLEDTKTYQDFNNERYPDDDIYELRSVFFQK